MDNAHDVSLFGADILGYQIQYANNFFGLNDLITIISVLMPYII